MVTVPRSSIDQVKIITEHDLLKFVGAATTALLVPLILWTFISLHNELGELSKGLVELHEQVAVLKTELKKQHEYTAAEFDVTKAQIRNVYDATKDVRKK
jgi:hypothetical protein